MLYDVVDRRVYKKTGKYVFFFSCLTKEEVLKIAAETATFKDNFMIVEHRPRT